MKLRAGWMESSGRNVVVGFFPPESWDRASRCVAGVCDVDIKEWARFWPAVRVLEEDDEERWKEGAFGGWVLRASASCWERRALALRRLISYGDERGFSMGVCGIGWRKYVRCA